MKIRDRKGTGKQSWNQEKKGQDRKSKKNEFRQKKKDEYKKGERERGTENQ